MVQVHVGPQLSPSDVGDNTSNELFQAAALEALCFRRRSLSVPAEHLADELERVADV